MKKLLLALLMLGLARYGYAGIITTDPFITPDSVTVDHLENFRTTVLDVINGNIGTVNIQNDSVAEVDMADDANTRIYFDDAFNNYVKSGLLPPTSSSLITTTTAGLAYIDGYRVSKDAVSHTYNPTVWTYVDLSNNGTYSYVESVIGAAEPGVTANSLRLARVSTDSTTVSVIRDDRVLSIATAGSEDFYRSGLNVRVTTPDTVIAGTGTIKHGSTYLSKVANSTLSLGTASDWVNGVSGRAVNTTVYVVMDSSGNIKLTTTAPTKSDTSGNTTGTLRYTVIGSTYYRVLGWARLNGTGSGELEDWEYSDISDVSTVNYINHVSGDILNINPSTIIPYDNTIPQNTEGHEFLKVVFVPSNTAHKIKIEGQLIVTTTDAQNVIVALFQDSTANALRAWPYNVTASAISTLPFEHEMTASSTAATTFKIRAGSAVATDWTINGGTSRTPLFVDRLKSFVRITEIP